MKCQSCGFEPVYIAEPLIALDDLSAVVQCPKCNSLLPIIVTEQSPAPSSLAERYYQWIAANKIDIVTGDGFEVAPEELHPALKPHTGDAVRWAARRGRALLASKFGMHKTRQQIELLRQVVNRNPGCTVMQVCPLGARYQFTEIDGPAMGIRFQYVRTDKEAMAADTPYLITNYERLRDGGLSFEYVSENITAICLDEAAILGNLGTKTQTEFQTLLQPIPYRWVATATPAPNDYRQLIYFADFLDVNDAGLSLTRWFGRNPDKAGDLELLPSMEEDFWKWVASWALFMQAPSDLGYSDDGYEMPPLTIRWHRLTADHEKAWEMTDSEGQRYLFKDTAAGVKQAIREKRDSMDIRVAKAKEIVDAAPDDHFIIWHDLEDERRSLKKAIPDATEVYGSQDLEDREERLLGFTNGDFRILATKPVIAGSGPNFQRYCHRAVYLGVGYKFRDFIQSIHRLQRYGQTYTVELDIIHTDAEDQIVQVLQSHWQDHDRLVERMSGMIRQYGLTSEALSSSIRRSLGVKREEHKGTFFHIVNNDTVLETADMADNSVDMILTSIPFGNHYEYVEAKEDFGHNSTDDLFWQQMDFLIPSLYRVLKPGRVAAIHVKDRILYGHQNRWHTVALWPFSDDCNRAFIKNGFIPAGRITVVTDVVRENNSTNRLGWSENAKDGSKMGVGLPEYVLLFRKPQTDITRSYADEPVRKSKKDYSRHRWQIDAHSFWRSDGNRVLTPEEALALDSDKLTGMDTGQIYRWHQEFSRTHPYNHEAHVGFGEVLENAGKDRLPARFMLFPPQAPEGQDEFVWTDILFMRTLNMSQARRRVEKHVCPFPLDIVSRLITRYSNPGDLVFDPFNGLGTTTYKAVEMGRRGRGHELNVDYYRASIAYCRDAEVQRMAPTLFDMAVYAGNGNGKNGHDPMSEAEVEIVERMAL